MNYKTIMLCAIVAGSMQSAWGMDEESADIQAAKANNKDEDYSLIIWIMTDKEGYNSIDRGCLAELAERTDSGDLKRRATECAGKFERAKKECINIGVNFATNPIFKDIAARMDSLIIVKTEQEAVRETLIRELKVAFIKGDIAKELDTAREIYLGKACGMMRQERSNN